LSEQQNGKNLGKKKKTRALLRGKRAASVFNRRGGGVEIEGNAGNGGPMKAIKRIHQI